MNKIEVLNPEEIGHALTKATEEAGIGDDSAIVLRGQFSDYYNNIMDQRTEALSITDETDPLQQVKAREVRLALRKERCSVENTRKKLKHESLCRGKAIDGFANVLKFMCEPVEAALKEVEEYAARKESERLDKLVEERINSLMIEGGNPSMYNLREMSEADFDITLNLAHRQRLEREEAARIAAEEAAEKEADRKAKAEADAQERERVCQENIKLKKEADVREAKAKKERAAAAEKLKKERQAREAAEAEAEKATKAEAKRKATAAAEVKKAEADAAKAARAPDKKKVLAYLEAISMVPYPAMATKEGKDVINLIENAMTDTARWIKKQAGTL